MKTLFTSFLLVAAVQSIICQGIKNRNLTTINFKEGIGQNFIRPDMNRTGYYSFMNDWEWILYQYKELKLLKYWKTTNTLIFILVMKAILD